MKRLVLLVLLPLSRPSFADWGDVYHCQETTHSRTTLEGERTDYKPVKFKFKLDENRKAMVFGKGGVFSGTVMVLREHLSLPSQESWSAIDFYSMGYFNKGKALFSMTTSTGLTSISANCVKL